MVLNLDEHHANFFTEEDPPIQNSNLDVSDGVLSSGKYIVHKPVFMRFSLITYFHLK